MVGLLCGSIVSLPPGFPPLQQKGSVVLGTWISHSPAERGKSWISLFCVTVCDINPKAVFPCTPVSIVLNIESPHAMARLKINFKEHTLKGHFWSKPMCRVLFLKWISSRKFLGPTWWHCLKLGLQHSYTFLSILSLLKCYNIGINQLFLSSLSFKQLYRITKFVAMVMVKIYWIQLIFAIIFYLRKAVFKKDKYCMISLICEM